MPDCIADRVAGYIRCMRDASNLLKQRADSLDKLAREGEGEAQLLLFARANECRMVALQIMQMQPPETTNFHFHQARR